MTVELELLMALMVLITLLMAGLVEMIGDCFLCASSSMSCKRVISARKWDFSMAFFTWMAPSFIAVTALAMVPWAGEDQYRHIYIQGQNFLHQGQTVHLRHLQISNDQVKLVIGKRLEGRTG
jgi:hypothetical protein